jgi:hypothetical protein
VHAALIFLFLYYKSKKLYLETAEIVHYPLQEFSTKYFLFYTVIPSLYEPFPGWLENCNGPVGIMFGVCKGFIHTLFGDPNGIVDYVPVDVCIQFMLIASWYKAISG